MFSFNRALSFLSDAAATSETVAAVEATEKEMKESRLQTLVTDENGKVLGALSAHLKTLGLSQSVFYSRLRAAAKEENFVSPFAEFAPGLQTIRSDSEYFAEADGGRAGKFVCMFNGGATVEVYEDALDAEKKKDGFVGCIRVSGRWCREDENMSEKYPALQRKKKDDGETSDAPSAPAVEVVETPTPVEQVDAKVAPKAKKK